MAEKFENDLIAIRCESLLMNGTGISISKQIACRRFIGYCSQYDALFDLMTGKEHLQFYGMLKGLRGKELQNQVRLLLRDTPSPILSSITRPDTNFLPQSGGWCLASDSNRNYLFVVAGACSKFIVS